MYVGLVTLFLRRAQIGKTSKTSKNGGHIGKCGPPFLLVLLVLPFVPTAEIEWLAKCRGRFNRKVGQYEIGAGSSNPQK